MAALLEEERNPNSCVNGEWIIVHVGAHHLPNDSKVLIGLMAYIALGLSPRSERSSGHPCLLLLY
ncbi:hypothetical protein GDO81_016516 [Engystomops pustulosus]|uniref:Uncharacterized protein n=1 Tax=Engystomops pustulosus TaxID=76066 RepID=A0AAV7AUX2_ENGPU|nr:hypothetical protein GDO81_016516 [Engystomops pustulosus]